MQEFEVRQRVQALMGEINPDAPGVEHLDFLRAKFDHGLGWCHFPEGHGGLGLSPKLQATIEDEVQKHSKSYVNPFFANLIGHGMGAPVVLTYATEEQKKRWLRPLYTNEEFWCQMFSEPSAGSDVAGLSMRAELDGDDWIINGQKVWTTLAHLATWGMLVARSNPDIAKHDGLSYFVVNMQSPGVEVRPLYQITGEAEFNEVFFDDAETAADLVIGGAGNGWAVAMGTLGFERGASTLGQQTGYRQELEALLALAQDNGSIDDPSLRQDLMRAWTELEILRYNQLRMLTALVADGVPGPEMSIGKLYWASWHRRLGELGIRVRGASGMVGVDATSPLEDPLGVGYRLDRLQRTFLYSRSHTIYGGSNQVQRNVLGERVLGLPREPR